MPSLPVILMNYERRRTLSSQDLEHRPNKDFSQFSCLVGMFAAEVLCHGSACSVKSKMHQQSPITYCTYKTPHEAESSICD